MEGELAGLLDGSGNQLGLLWSFKQVCVPRDTWKYAVLWWAPVPVIEVEMTAGTLESALPGGC